MKLATTHRPRVDPRSANFESAVLSKTETSCEPQLRITILVWSRDVKLAFVYVCCYKWEIDFPSLKTGVRTERILSHVAAKRFSVQGAQNSIVVTNQRNWSVSALSPRIFSVRRFAGNIERVRAHTQTSLSFYPL